jgi:hypothetical protein
MGQFVLFDYTGQKFGNLTAIEFVERKNNMSYWRFRCDCGKEYVCAVGNIVKRNGRSCTCNKKPKKNLTGMKFGRLTAIKPLRQGKQGMWIWLCKCDCGNTKEVSSTQLLQHLTTSCGCARFKEDAYRNHPEYTIYTAIKRRCNNKNCKSYYRYGGRGIRMCEEWSKDFMKFLEDMGKRPSPKHSIERIDNNGNYEPSNCRWATNIEQANNKSNNVKFTYNDCEYTLKQFARKFNFNYKNLHYHYKQYNCDIDKLLDFCKKKGLAP